MTSIDLSNRVIELHVQYVTSNMIIFDSSILYYCTQHWRSKTIR